MATLVSPGVSVSVTDESLYTSAGPGTVPLIFIATSNNKPTPDGTGIAEGTLASNAEKLYLISSQRELIQTFGEPDFNEVGGSARHGYPLNEYGLLAAYSYLGVANRAYVLRADVDLAELQPLTEAPTGAPIDFTYWLNTSEFVPGLFVWDDTAGEWVAETVNVYLNPTDATIAGQSLPNAGYVDGAVLVSFDSNGNVAYFKRAAGLWQPLGTNEDFQYSTHTNVPEWRSTGSPNALVDGDYWLKTTSPNLGLDIPLSYYNASTGAWVDTNTIPVYADHAAYYAAFSAGNVTQGTVVGFENGAGFDLEWHNGGSQVVVTGTVPFTGTLAGAGTLDINSAPTINFAGGEDIDAVIQLINTASIPGVVASKTAGDRLVVTSTTGADITFASSGSWAAGVGIVDGTYSNFAPLGDAAPAYFATGTEPVTGAVDGTYWYNPSFDYDILINDGNGNWAEFGGTITAAPAAPAAPAADDLWIDTDQTEDYPVIYRRNAGNTAWVLIDNADQTTTKGILFADARPTNGGALDADAPDPLLYPRDLLLWNTRYSGRNVKVFRENYTFEGTPIGDRWVNASGNREDGSPYMGEDAMKRVITMKLAAAITSNEAIRSDTIFYNLLSAPGFPELIDEMIVLNQDRKEQAFIIGDTPFKLRDNSTELQAWATNANLAPTNGDDGLVSAYPYLGVYYPSGFTTNIDGSEVVVPASHMMLRVMAFNDQVAYPWFAPAGFQRGTVTNATSVGYLDAEDEFVPVTLNEGQRDVLYLNNVNPIAFVPGRGLVVYGQKTRNPVESALDRVNVARLVNYLRYQADRIARPFLFEPNDGVTRDAVKNAFDTFLAELITLRALFDFLVVCDTSNNTPARIDRNELWVDIAIQPIKAVEFIYIPIRIQNTGADLAG